MITYLLPYKTDSCRISYTPAPGHNYADEDLWFALVTGVNNEGGPITIRPLVSCRRLLALVLKGGDGVLDLEEYVVLLI